MRGRVVHRAVDRWTSRAGYTHAMAAPPTVLFALTAGLLTALTPCVYPMIPITISIFGAKTGVSRGRALGLATFYVAGIAFMFGALGTVFALLGKAFGTFLANPWVIVPLAIFFVLMGAVDVRRVRAGAAERAAESPVARRRQGLRRRVPDGPGRRHHRRALHRAAAGRHPRLRRDHARRGLRVRAARDLRRRHRPALLGAGRVLDVAAALGAVDGVGEERLRHRAVHGRALLPEERGAAAGDDHRPHAGVSRRRARDGGWSGWRSAPCT